MRWCSGLSHVSIKLKFCRVSGSNPGPNHGGPFFGLFMGFLDFLLAPFNNLWYYIIVQWSKTHQKCVIVLIAWSWQNHDHCAIDFVVVNHVLWVNSIENVKSQLQTSKVNCKLQNLNTILRTNSYFCLFLLLFRRKKKRNCNYESSESCNPKNWTFSSKGNVHKSSFGLCSWVPGPIKGCGAQKQRPHELLWTLWFEKRVYLCRNPSFLKKKLKFQLTFGSSNWLSLVAIDFTQSTWFTTSKVNCKNISEICQKNFQFTFSLQLTLLNCTWSGP